MVLPNDVISTLYEKSTNLGSLKLFHVCWEFMLVDLQGAVYNLYDPEVANLELQSAAD